MKKQNTDVVLQQGKLSEDICTCGELRKAARAITLLYDNTFKSSGLLSTQFGVLQVLCEIDSIQITDLAGKLGMDRTTLTRNLSVLERDGFIKISQGIRSSNENCDCYSKRTRCSVQNYSYME